MTVRSILLVSLLLSTFSINAAEDIVIDYSYAGAHGKDLSNLRGSIKIDSFSDDRKIENPNLITDSDIGDISGGFQAEKALAELVQIAFTEGFEQGGATLVDTGEELRISGKILSTQAQLVDRSGVESIQLTVRTNLQLHRGGRMVWQITLFGRGVVPTEEGMAAAVKAALDRTVNELVRDDYFLQQVK